MEMIARTKMKRAVDGVLSVRPYALYAQELLQNLGSDKTIENPYLDKKNKNQNSNKVLLIVIAGDKGLCGGYNANIIREFRRRQKASQELDIIAIGKKAVLETKKAGLPLLSEYADIPDKITAEFIHPIAEQARKKYLTGDYKEVELLFTDFESSFVQKVRTRVILPIDLGYIASVLDESASEETKGENLAKSEISTFSPYLLEPSANIIIETIVPKLVDMSLMHALFESRASEESSRMFAMKNATENAEELKADLTLTFNRIRQQGITQEIAEIAAGAEAIK